MAEQVVVGTQAAAHARQMLAAAQRFAAAARQVMNTSSALTSPGTWEGAAAQQFRAEQQAMTAHLQAVGPAVLRMAAGAATVIQQIDQEDAAGLTNAPLPPTGNSGYPSQSPLSAFVGNPWLTTTHGPDSSALGAKIGNDLGQIVLGVGMMFLGGGGEIAGVALDATGVGAVLGVPANIVSAGVIASGAGLALNGAIDLGRNLAAMSSSSSSSTGGSGGGPLSNRVRPPQNGDTNYVVDNPNDWSDTITDIDKVDNGTLWEEKTATGQDPRMDTDAWIQKNVLRKLDSYVRARQYLPGWQNAPLGIDFTQPGSTPAFRSAVEAAVKEWQAANPGVSVTVRWAP